jgi:hypothetical protein
VGSGGIQWDLWDPRNISTEFEEKHEINPRGRKTDSTGSHWIPSDRKRLQ